MTDTRPFSGIRVIDLTHVLAGPFATYQLAVLGAEVIKIEDPNDPDQSRGLGTDPELNKRGMGTNFLTQGSNKKSMTLNLKTEGGRAILKRMVKTADVFVENYRPGAFEALGLGYRDLAQINPRLIYCSMSAFGQDGPRREHTAYDFVIQATSGLMGMTGTPQVNPLKCGASVVDYATGAMGAFALSSALFQRSQTGKGQHIDLAMFDVAMILMSSNLTGYLHNGVEPKPSGNAMAFSTNSCYDTGGGALALGASNIGQQRRLWEALGHPEMVKADNAARDADRKRETALLTDILKSRSADAWEAFFQEHHVPAARVRRMSEALADPQRMARGVVHKHQHVPALEKSLEVPVTAFKFDHGGASVETPPHEMGADTDTVLAALGYSADEIAELRTLRAV